MRYFILFLFSLTCSFVGAQNNICLGDSMAICAGESVTLDICSATDSNVVYLEDVNVVDLGDDQYSEVIDIGFDFQFYGADYSECIISSNGYISFDTGGAEGLSMWSIDNPVPSTDNPTNAIMAPWQDYNPSDPESGIVGSTTIGTAPNRKFIVIWKDQVMYGTSQSGCSALVLYENSNKIEIFLDEKPSVAWNGGAAIQATHNINGTLADAVPGRNWPTQWVANLDGQEWIPDGPNKYIQNEIPYIAYIEGDAQTQWFDTEGNPYATLTDDLTVVPDPSDDADSIGYFINYSSCAVGELLTSDTSWVYVYSLKEQPTPVSCPGGNDGVASVEVFPEPSSTMNITYNWLNTGGQTTQSISDLEAGNYDIEVSIDGVCSLTTTVVVEEVPPMEISFVDSEDITCNSANDGYAEVNIKNGTAPYSYNWLNSSSTSASANDLAIGTNTVEVIDANGCEASFSLDLEEPEPLRIISFDSDDDVCEGDTVLFSAQGAGGSSSYIYSWYVNGSLVDTGDSVRIVVDQNSASYCVTLSEECGSPVADTCLIITLPNEIDPLISADILEGCVPLSVNFQNITDATNIDYSLWDYGTGIQDTVSGLEPTDFEYLNPGVYDIKLTVIPDEGCSYKSIFKNFITVYALPVPSFQINPNPVSLYEPLISAVNQSSLNAVLFEWYADGAIPSYSESVDQDFRYPNLEADYPLMLVAESNKGCRDTLIQTVRVIDEVVMFAPNSFTPDGDNINDNWQVFINNIDVNNFHLEVFNRWGELVFESFNAEQSWNGSYGGGIPVPEGTYIWKVETADKETGDKYEFQGHVTIIR